VSERDTPEVRASLMQDRIHKDSGAVRAGRSARSCTCHPDDMMPPCERKYALSECRISRLERQHDDLADALRELVRLKDLEGRVMRKDFATFEGWAGACDAVVTDTPHAWDNARTLLARIDAEAKPPHS